MASRPGKTGARLKVNDAGLRDLAKSLAALTSREVLVGFPDETADRDEDERSGSITNAALGYIHDTGMPDQNIPARPFMRPGIEAAEKAIAGHMLSAARAIVKDPKADPDARMHRVGQAAALGIKRKINEGVPPPLADSTLRARARRGRKGAALELELRANGMTAGMDAAKTLVDTGQLRNAVSYAIRSRKAREK